MSGRRLILVTSVVAGVLLAAVATQALAGGGEPQAHAAATCSDYSNQADAQRAKDTRDADGDGIYCESLPCPCLKPGGGGGGSTPPAPPPPAAPGVRCGVERWPVKTLSDPAARQVNFSPKRTTVDRLRHLRVPKVGSKTPRLLKIERSTYRVRAQLIEAKYEEDRDIHLVIADPNDERKTMIVEFPYVGCQGATSSHKKRAMKLARAAFGRDCPQPGRSSFKALSGMATIEGVGFVDKKHGQRGLAPNGIELHPVLRFRSVDCTPA